MTTSPEHDDGVGDMSRHLCPCDACRQFVREHQPPAGLQERVLLVCESELASLRRRAALRPPLALAGLAALALFTLTLHVSLLPPTVVAPGAADTASLAAAAWTPAPAAAAWTPAPADAAWTPAPAAGAHWLANTLRPDGRFDTGRLEVPHADEVGLHALALLALASADEGSERTPETTDAALRAARWLLDQQDDDGSIGAPVGAGFDHALGTVALLEAGVLTGDAEVRAGARRAVALIAECQEPDGGWQPRAPGQAGASLAQTAWTLAALLRAQQLGVTELQPAIARGQSRLATDLGPRELADLGPGVGRVLSADLARSVTPSELDLPAVRAVALGASRPRAPTPAGGLYAASFAVLALPAFPH